MPRLPIATAFVIALTAGCTKPAADAPAADTTATAAEPTRTGPRWAVVVLYNQPKDPAAFEKYYAETHLPLLAAKQQEIGFTQAELVKFPSNLDGSAPSVYRKAELWFDSEEALRQEPPLRDSRRWPTTSLSSRPAALQR